MNVSKKTGLSLLAALVFASMIIPFTTAVTPTYGVSSVGINAGTSLVYSLYGQGPTYGKLNGFKENMTITAVGLNTNKYVNNNVVELNGTYGRYNTTEESWEEMVSEQPLMEWNGTFYNYSLLVPFDIVYIIPHPVNFTWLNISLWQSMSGYYTCISEMTTNMTMGSDYILTTYSSTGIATIISLYNSTNHLVFQFTLDVTGGGGNIPFGDFFVGVSVFAIFGVVVVLIKKRKINVKA